MFGKWKLCCHFMWTSHKILRSTRSTLEWYTGVVDFSTLTYFSNAVDPAIDENWELLSLSGIVQVHVADESMLLFVTQKFRHKFCAHLAHVQVLWHNPTNSWLRLVYISQTRTLHSIGSLCSIISAHVQHCFRFATATGVPSELRR